MSNWVIIIGLILAILFVFFFDWFLRQIIPPRYKPRSKFKDRPPGGGAIYIFLYSLLEKSKNTFYEFNKTILRDLNSKLSSAGYMVSLKKDDKEFVPEENEYLFQVENKEPSTLCYSFYDGENWEKIAEFSADDVKNKSWDKTAIIKTNEKVVYEFNKKLYEVRSEFQKTLA